MQLLESYPGSGCALELCKRVPVFYSQAGAVSARTVNLLDIPLKLAASTIMTQGPESDSWRYIVRRETPRQSDSETQCGIWT